VATIVSAAEILDVDVGYFFDEMPKKRSDKFETTALTQIALALHGRRLIDAFLNLKNDAMRGAVADLAQVLAQ
jgi:hypothetical protein